MLDHVRVVPQNHLIEIAPDQLGEPHLCANRTSAPVCKARELAGRDRAEAQVNREVRRAASRGVVSFLLILVDAGLEVLEHLLRARFAGRQWKVIEIGEREAHLFQAWN